MRSNPFLFGGIVSHPELDSGTLGASRPLCVRDAEINSA